MMHPAMRSAKGPGDHARYDGKAILRSAQREKPFPTFRCILLSGDSVALYISTFD
jgi:hypothetical protein